MKLAEADESANPTRLRWLARKRVTRCEEPGRACRQLCLCEPPAQRYGIAIAGQATIPRRVFTRNEALDSCVAPKGLKSERLRRSLAGMLAAELAASRALEDVRPAAHSPRSKNREACARAGIGIIATAAIPSTIRIVWMTL